MGRKTVFVVFVIAGTLIGYINAQNCTSTECSKSYFDPDLIITPDKGCYSNIEQVSISCNGDFGGPTFNQCNGGTWMLPSSTCDVFTCQPPTVGDNLNISPVKSEYTAREVITFTCDQGYSLTGTSSAQCDQANVWNPSTVPVCIASCDEPTIANGGLTSTGPYNDGDTAEVQCNDGYNIESGFSSIIDCDDGAWGTIPRCLGSCNISAVPNSDTPPSGVNIVHGESYTIDCFGDHSYNLEVSFTVTCDDGVLSSTVPPSCYGQSLEDSISLYCNSDKFIVEIPGELLGDNPGLGSVLLGTCEGSYYDGQYLFANSSYTACGTTIESADNGVVTTEDYIEINTECVFDQNNLVSSSAVVQGVISKALASNAQYDISFGAYLLSDFSETVSDGVRVDTNTDIFLLSEVNQVAMVDLFPKRCYATPNQNRISTSTMISSTMG
ncbi:putative sushi, von Willebrand factor type A [Apostichopus japonicus]|uniref:Putative sushi, von Willebrand factor type A n=1 Tax=Stichopus japonicus TaxID=307972 RepID=A0A2G8LMX7_STIJA|nr:putative sushi, von Willebrand factor type A [Apostichopus japonicus]